MKILFLDVDGVLNTAAWFKTTQLPRHVKSHEKSAAVDPYRVALVHRILEATGAKVVVSSAWRLHSEGLAAVQQWTAPHYLDRTPEYPSFYDRHKEIQEWLDKRHDVTHYAILDDDLVASHGHGDNFFKTEWYGDGLTQEIANQIIAHLNRPL